MYVKQLRPSLGFLGTGEKLLLQWNRGTKAKLSTRKQILNLGTGNIRKQIFDFFWGTGEQANLLQGNKGTGTCIPLGGPQSRYIL